MNPEFEDEFEDMVPEFEELLFGPATKRESSADVELTPELVKQLIEVGRIVERSEAAGEKARHGSLRRLLQRVAAAARWDLMCFAIDHRVARGDTNRTLPDLRALFADNAHVFADFWKLHEGDDRRQEFFNAINRKGVTKDTEAAATRYLNARLDGLAPDEARRAVEGWSLFRP